MPDYSRYQFLKIEKQDGVAIVTMNRPDRLNAVHPPMHLELEDIWVDLDRDSEVRAIVLTGAGRAFCAGGDIGGMRERIQGRDAGFDPVRGLSPTRGGRHLIRNMLEVEAPIIAAVNGDAVGLGATIALFCDVIFASRNARIGDPHVRVGLVAGDGGAVIWPLLCGVARAKQYLMTGDLMSAEEAERIGLINKVVPEGQALEEALKFATRLAKGPTKAIKWTKYSVNKIVKEYMNLVLDTSLSLEGISFLTEDHKEAVSAFLEKRQPSFRGQ
ncbi:Short-chain-enoyl-CoA hydratase [bacterium HR23]|nr:Short-chain-enoyl-CoA hydratase [bacterium HR23]